MNGFAKMIRYGGDVGLLGFVTTLRTYPLGKDAEEYALEKMLNCPFAATKPIVLESSVAVRCDPSRGSTVPAFVMYAF